MKHIGGAVQQCHFLDLQPELRNEIYGQIINNATTIKPRNLQIVGIGKHAPGYAITSVCRQTRSESLKLFKSSINRYLMNNVFSVYIVVALAEADLAIYAEELAKLEDLPIQMLKISIDGLALGRQFTFIERSHDLHISFGVVDSGAVQISAHLYNSNVPDWVNIRAAENDQELFSSSEARQFREVAGVPGFASTTEARVG